MKHATMLVMALMLLAASVFGQARHSRMTAPSGIAQQLIRDDDVRMCVREYERGQVDLLRYLKVQAVSLNGDGQPEWIVQGDDGPKECLHGERAFKVWVYRRVRGNYELLLKSSNDLHPIATATNGYRDLENSQPLGAFEMLRIIYKFDGRQYRDCVIKHFAPKGNRWVLQSTENKCSGRTLSFRRPQPVHAARQDAWDVFWGAFRAAIGRRDRRALREMMARDFEWTFGGHPPGDRRDTFFRNLDKDRRRGWLELDRVIAQGAVVSDFFSRYNKTPTRLAPPAADEDGYDSWRAYFELGPNGRWRWTSFVTGD